MHKNKTKTINSHADGYSIFGSYLSASGLERCLSEYVTAQAQIKRRKLAKWKKDKWVIDSLLPVVPLLHVFMQLYYNSINFVVQCSLTRKPVVVQFFEEDFGSLSNSSQGTLSKLSQEVVSNLSATVVSLASFNGESVIIRISFPYLHLIISYKDLSVVLSRRSDSCYLHRHSCQKRYMWYTCPNFSNSG